MKIPIAEETVSLLKKYGLTFAAAESCTGGGVAQKITSVPGASEIFLGGIVSYANEVKQHLLGVTTDVLNQHGAVSRECAEQMIKGIRAAIGAAAAVSLTGIAGPGGGSIQKPVGLVYIGVSVHDRIAVYENRFKGDREQIREQAADKALELLKQMILEVFAK